MSNKHYNKSPETHYIEMMDGILRKRKKQKKARAGGGRRPVKPMGRNYTGQ